MTSLSEYTAEFEVVEIDTVSKEGRHKFWPFVVTKLKVVRTLKGEKKTDFVWMYNASGTDCERGMFPTHLGQRFILNGRFLDVERFAKYFDDNQKRTFFYISSCGVNLLDIDSGYVYGIITKNNSKAIYKNYQKLQKTDSAAATAYYEKVYRTNHPDRVQKMKMEEFYKLFI